jgi:hypothetical protein
VFARRAIARSNGLQAAAVGLASMSELPEDTNYASFWPDAPMPTVLDLLPPPSASAQDPAQEPEGLADRAPQRRRRSSSRYSHVAEEDQVCTSVAT